jgi:serine/threonine-protein kinase
VSIATDSAGNIFFGDSLDYIISKIDTNGILTIIAGSGVVGEFADGPALSSPIPTNLRNISVDKTTGDIYVCAETQIAKLTPSVVGYTLSVIMTNSVFPNLPSGSPPGFASLVFDPTTGYFYAISQNTRKIYRIRIQTGSFISTDFSLSNIVYCLAITVDSSGNVYALDWGPGDEGDQNKIVIFDRNGQVISRIERIFGASRNSKLAIFNIAVGSSDDIYVTEPTVSVIQKIDKDRNIRLIAGDGSQPPYSGDGGDPVFSNLNIPLGVAVDSKSNLLICDSLNARIRKITPAATTTTDKTNYNPPWFTPLDYKQLCNCKLVADNNSKNMTSITTIIYDGNT